MQDRISTEPTDRTEEFQFNLANRSLERYFLINNCLAISKTQKTEEELNLYEEQNYTFTPEITYFPTSAKTYRVKNSNTSFFERSVKWKVIESLCDT